MIPLPHLSSWSQDYDKKMGACEHSYYQVELKSWNSSSMSKSKVFRWNPFLKWIPRKGPFQPPAIRGVGYWDLQHLTAVWDTPVVPVPIGCILQAILLVCWHDSMWSFFWNAMLLALKSSTGSMDQKNCMKQAVRMLTVDNKGAKDLDNNLSVRKPMVLTEKNKLAKDLANF